MKKIRVGVLIISLLIPLLIGGISAAFSSQGMSEYGSINKPPLSPPAWVFPIAWTVLYLIMGLASYFVFVAETDSKSRAIALSFYAIQLAMNYLWSIIFFNWGMYLFAFIWLMIMWCFVIVCAFRFFGISRIAAYLFIPYILWLTFAAYLNLGAYLLKVQHK